MAGKRVPVRGQMYTRGSAVAVHKGAPVVERAGGAGVVEGPAPARTT